VERETALAAAGEWLVFFPDSVHVAFTVSETEGRRVFPDLPLAVRNATRAARVEPETVALTVRGSQRAVAALQLGAGVAYVDVEGLPDGPHQLAVTLALPRGIGVERIDPEEVRVTIGPAAATAPTRDQPKR
jgi:YbbR domain-containing protein